MSITLIGKDYKYTVPTQNDYSDLTPMVKLNELIEDIAPKIDTIVVKHSSLEEFMKAIFLAESLHKTSKGNYFNLVLPYVLGARQDRINSTGDILDTAHSIANIINRGPFANVLILDPHSKVIENLLEECLVYPLEQVACRIKQKYHGIISPDKGAIDRAHVFDNVLMTSGVTDAQKVRDVSTGKLSGFEVKVQQGKHYLMVDDICDAGGTFIGLNQKIREQGATADLYVTHGLFSKGVTELTKNFGNIYTTDSLDETPIFGVEVINVVDDMISYMRKL